MTKTTYDLVIPLGEACSGTETLRAAGLQHLSFPYDWIANAESDTDRARHDLVTRAQTLASRFNGWLRKEDLTFVASTPNGRDVYINKPLGIVLNHDFPTGLPFDQAFERVSARYRRRICRLLELLDHAKRVLIVRVERPAEKLLKPLPTSSEDCRAARRILSEAFPRATFDICLLAFERGRAEANRTESTIEPGLTRIAFDYHNDAPGFLEYAVRIDRTSRLLRQRFAVIDYRTRDEKRTYRRRLIAKRLARWLKPLRRLFSRR